MSHVLCCLVEETKGGQPLLLVGVIQCEVALYLVLCLHCVPLTTHLRVGHKMYPKLMTRISHLPRLPPNLPGEWI